MTRTVRPLPGTAPNCWYRITSYNVCYTKLLRGTPDTGSAIRRKRGIVRQNGEAALSVTGFDIPETLPDRAGLPTGNVTHCVYDESDIVSALESVGKHTPADELNCGGCGYDCCREP